jgi:hypothetical protein
MRPIPGTLICRPGRPGFRAGSVLLTGWHHMRPIPGTLIRQQGLRFGNQGEVKPLHIGIDCAQNR